MDKTCPVRQSLFFENKRLPAIFNTYGLPSLENDFTDENMRLYSRSLGDVTQSGFWDSGSEELAEQNYAHRRLLSTSNFNQRPVSFVESGVKMDARNWKDNFYFKHKRVDSDTERIPGSSLSRNYPRLQSSFYKRLRKKYPVAFSHILDKQDGCQTLQTSERTLSNAEAKRAENQKMKDTNPALVEKGFENTDAMPLTDFNESELSSKRSRSKLESSVKSTSCLDLRERIAQNNAQLLIYREKLDKTLKISSTGKKMLVSAEVNGENKHQKEIYLTKDRIRDLQNKPVSSELRNRQRVSPELNLRHAVSPDSPPDSAIDMDSASLQSNISGITDFGQAPIEFDNGNTYESVESAMEHYPFQMASGTERIQPAIGYNSSGSARDLPQQERISDSREIHKSDFCLNTTDYSDEHCGDLAYHREPGANDQYLKSSIDLGLEQDGHLRNEKLGKNPVTEKRQNRLERELRQEQLTKTLSMSRVLPSSSGTEGEELASLRNTLLAAAVDRNKNKLLEYEVDDTDPRLGVPEETFDKDLERKIAERYRRRKGKAKLVKQRHPTGGNFSENTANETLSPLKLSHESKNAGDSILSQIPVYPIDTDDTGTLLLERTEERVPISGCYGDKCISARQKDISTEASNHFCTNSLTENPGIISKDDLCSCEAPAKVLENDDNSVSSNYGNRLVTSIDSVIESNAITGPHNGPRFMSSSMPDLLVSSRSRPYIERSNRSLSDSLVEENNRDVYVTANCNIYRPQLDLRTIGSFRKSFKREQISKLPSYVQDILNNRNNTHAGMISNSDIQTTQNSIKPDNSQTENDELLDKILKESENNSVLHSTLPETSKYENILVPNSHKVERPGSFADHNLTPYEISLYLEDEDSLSDSEIFSAKQVHIRESEDICQEKGLKTAGLSTIHSETSTVWEKRNNSSIDSSNGSVHPVVVHYRKKNQKKSSIDSGFSDSKEISRENPDLKREFRNSNPCLITSMSPIAHIEGSRYQKSNLQSSKDMSRSKVSLFNSARAKISSLRKAKSLDHLNQQYPSNRGDNHYDPASRTSLPPPPPPPSSRMKKAPSLKSLFNIMKKSKSKNKSNKRAVSSQPLRKAGSLCNLTVDTPSHPRAIGKVIDLNPNGTQTVELFRPPNCPFGIYIARATSQYNYSVFVTKFCDGNREKLFAGLLNVGDEILQINNEDIRNLSLDEVYDLMALRDNMVLRTIPVWARCVN